MTPQSIFHALAGGKWKKSIGVALFLVACDPFNPWGSCGDFDPPCSTREFKLALYDGGGIWNSDRSFVNDTTYTVDSTDFALHFVEVPSPISALSRTGGGACAYALSCGGCTDAFQADSVYFSTDIVSVNGDTLKAGYNFAVQPLPEGFRGYSGSSLSVETVTGFRDSLFQVHFVGKIDGETMSASAMLRITNPALLLP